MTIKDLLENDKIVYNISVEEFTNRYLYHFNLTEKQMLNRDELITLLYYGFMIAIRWHILISMEEISSVRKAYSKLKLSNMKILKERLFKDTEKISSFKYNDCKDSSLYSDIEAIKFIEKHFKDKKLYDRFISFYSLGFWTGMIYAKKRYDKIFSFTITNAIPLDKKSKEFIKIAESSLPEFIEEFNTFVLSNKKILKLI